MHAEVHVGRLYARAMRARAQTAISIADPQDDIAFQDNRLHVACQEFRV